MLKLCIYQKYLDAKKKDFVFNLIFLTISKDKQQKRMRNGLKVHIFLILFILQFNSVFVEIIFGILSLFIHYYD